MNITDKDRARFYKKVLRGGDSDCWLWTGAKDDRGYGKFFITKKCISAHKFSFVATYGEPQFRVLHVCGNSQCVNPTHLKDGKNKGRPKK